MPCISVIILNWNGKHLLPECLESLSLQTFQDFEVILVDNGSTDGSSEWVSENYPAIRVIALAENQGFCRGNNIGIRAAGGEYIVLLNNDTKVEPDWLEQLYSVISSDDRIAACDSKVLYYDHPDLIWTAGGDYSVAGTVRLRGSLEKDGAEFQGATEVFVAVACAAIYRKSVFDEIGLFDEDFFAGYEDVDWSFRAHLHGYQILNVPAARVYHKVSATHGYNSDTYVYNGQKNVFCVFLKNMPSPLLVKYFFLHLLYTLGSLIYFMRIGRGNAYIKAKADAIKQLPLLWRKRRMIQKGREVAIAEIDALLSRTWLKDKLRKYNR